MWSHNYFYSFHIVLGIISDIEMIWDLWEDLCSLCAYHLKVVLSGTHSHKHGRTTVFHCIWRYLPPNNGWAGIDLLFGGAGTFVMARVRRSEGNPKESVLSIHSWVLRIELRTSALAEPSYQPVSDALKDLKVSGNLVTREKERATLRT